MATEAMNSEPSVFIFQSIFMNRALHLRIPNRTAYLDSAPQKHPRLQLMKGIVCTMFMSLLMVVTNLNGQEIVGYRFVKSVPVPDSVKLGLFNDYTLVNDGKWLVATFGFKPSQHFVFDLKSGEPLCYFETPGHQSYYYYDEQIPYEIHIYKNHKTYFIYNMNSQLLIKSRRKKPVKIDLDRGRYMHIYSNYLFNRQYAQEKNWLFEVLERQWFNLYHKIEDN